MRRVTVPKEVLRLVDRTLGRKGAAVFGAGVAIGSAVTWMKCRVPADAAHPAAHFGLPGTATDVLTREG